MGIIKSEDLQEVLQEEYLGYKKDKNMALLQEILERRTKIKKKERGTQKWKDNLEYGF